MFTKPADVVELWLQYVNEGSIDDIISLYNSSSYLLPTFSNKRLVGLKQIESYFEKLATHEDLSVDLHKRTAKYQSVYGPVHNAYGIYLWKFAVDGEKLNFEARYTFTINLDEECPIMHQHSSQVPRTL